MHKKNQHQKLIRSLYEGDFTGIMHHLPSIKVNAWVLAVAKQLHLMQFSKLHWLAPTLALGFKDLHWSASVSIENNPAEEWISTVVSCSLRNRVLMYLNIQRCVQSIVGTHSSCKWHRMLCASWNNNLHLHESELSKECQHETQQRESHQPLRHVTNNMMDVVFILGVPTVWNRCTVHMVSYPVLTGIRGSCDTGNKEDGHCEGHDKAYRQECGVYQTTCLHLVRNEGLNPAIENATEENHQCTSDMDISNCIFLLKKNFQMSMFDSGIKRNAFFSPWVY